MRKGILCAILAFSLLLTSCNNVTNETNSGTSEVTTSSSDTTTETTVSEENLDNSTPYVHGEEGYFSLIDEGYGTPVKTQIDGTCWVTAASISMESNYLIRNNESINIDLLDLLDIVYTEDKDEGFFLMPGVDAEDMGGWNTQVTESAANGFGDYILCDASYYDSCSIDEIKDAIRTNGAMYVAVSDFYSRYFQIHEGYQTRNDPTTDYFDHAVVLVGWDDNFPKEYFSYEPENNGAWLALNTRGESWGNGGYYWLSYETPLAEQTIYMLSDEYDHVISYDAGFDNVISCGEQTTVSNVYHESGLLRAVGTYTTSRSQNIHIRICNSTMTETYYEQDAYFEYRGYHVVDLDTPIEVSNYSIVITYEGDAPVEGETWEDELLSYTVNIDNGQSFVLIEGSWIDLNSDNIKDILGIDYAPNNCCINAIY